MTQSSPEPSKIAAACAYCERPRPLAMLEPCCERAEHAGRLVCADIHDCLGVVLVALHESERRLEQPATNPQPAREPVVSLHADTDGVAPGDAPDDVAAVAVGDAELQARLTAARAVLGDFVRFGAGEVIAVDGAADWRAWADRLSRHLSWVLEAVGGAS